MNCDNITNCPPPAEVVPKEPEVELENAEYYLKFFSDEIKKTITLLLYVSN